LKCCHWACSLNYEIENYSVQNIFLCILSAQLRVVLACVCGNGCRWKISLSFSWTYCLSSVLTLAKIRLPLKKWLKYFNLRLALVKSNRNKIKRVRIYMQSVLHIFQGTHMPLFAYLFWGHVAVTISNSVEARCVYAIRQLRFVASIRQRKQGTEKMRMQGRKSFGWQSS